MCANTKLRTINISSANNASFSLPNVPMTVGDCDARRVAQSHDSPVMFSKCFAMCTNSKFQHLPPATTTPPSPKFKPSPSDSLPSLSQPQTIPETEDGPSTARLQVRSTHHASPTTMMLAGSAPRARASWVRRAAPNFSPTPYRSTADDGISYCVARR